LTREASPEVEPARSGVLQRLLLRSSTLASFQIRDYRWLWASSFSSLMAMNMLMITRGWMILRLADDSPMALALVMVSMALPMMLVSPIGGVLADRMPKRRMLVWGQGGNVLLTLVVATLDYTGLIAFWHLIATGFVTGGIMAMIMPSRQAIISDVVPEDKLMNGIALVSSGMNLSTVLGPAVAGVLIVYIGTAGVLYLIAGVYVVSMLTISVIKGGGEASARSGNGMAGDIREGLRYVASSPTLLGLIIMAFIPVMFGMSYYVLLPAWAREALDVQPDGLGMLMMTIGVGALAGTIMLASLRSFRRRGALLLGTCVAWGIALAVFSQATTYGAAIPLLLFIGLASALFRVLSMTLIQQHASPEMRGRVMSIAMMTFGAMFLSVLPFGAIAERWGTPDALLLSGALLALFTVIFTFAYPRFRWIA
jgi:MFS family permease